MYSLTKWKCASDTVMSEYKRPTVASLLSRWLRCWSRGQQANSPSIPRRWRTRSWNSRSCTNENNKKLRSLIADLKSHVKLALPCELNKAKSPCVCRFASTSNDHSISDGETELETFQGDTHIANRRDQAAEYYVEQLLLHFKRKAGQRRYGQAKKFEETTKVTCWWCWDADVLQSSRSRIDPEWPRPRA